MPRLIKKRSQKAGLPPGTPVHIGEQRSETTRITLFKYNEHQVEEKESTQAKECTIFEDQSSVTWINVTGLHQVEVLEELNGCFGLHPLVLEDILNTDQRPKMEDYGDYLYIVLKTLFMNGDQRDEVESEQVSLILGSNFVLSFLEKEGPLFGPIRERLRNGKGRIRKMGPDYLVHAILDAIVDHYFIVLEKLGEKIEFLEEEVVTQPLPTTLQVIHRLKREMIYLRKAVWPLREVIGGLERGESSLIKEPTVVYLRDIYDHTIQVIDNIETFRDMLSGMMDIYLSSISNRMNEVMKVLTIIATLFIPLTFIVGLYGMNFKYMPELDWPWGYPSILALMLAVTVFMLIYFKRKRWI
ncbi:MAG: magnesium and cobalt transport protein CorA [Deltaproteobacteria bacterium RBG_13_43_22]|nr:MAG: magnesium and cobalt transport protein CorA [Deltaproteobacteria bacterium RBG_13_43_22]